MIKEMKRYFWEFFALFAVAIPFWASAQIWSGRYDVTCNTEPYSCNFCDAIKVAINVIDFLTIIAVPLAVAAIVYGGARILLSAGNEKNVSTGTGAMKAAVIGFIIVMASWLIVHEVTQLLAGDGSLNPFQDIECESATAPVYPSAGGGPAAGGPAAGGPAAGTYGEAEARSLLASNGIGVNKAACGSGVNVGGCTDLEGMRPATVNDVIGLKSSCGCEITVTGGTEPGHAAGAQSHANGYKVDIRPTSDLDAYIQNNFTPIGSRGGAHGGDQYKNPADGAIYTREGDHWDITVPG